ncbi:succinyl-diaminopimelate desuccinylase [Lasius niger]|uniref:Succinyl-diaminopimelate desuccinylase n=1 Tax=Lasius niger TaxID=67767 RepID=A0A0J7MZ08_LASNI|nr:succinyl-diaminopimelate desuccinylase [Lasius niger]
MLETLGFSCQNLPFGPKGEETPNLFASIGTKETGEYLCFAGHTDVVPSGEGWRIDPFAGEISDGVITGRGAVDMKGGLACMMSAVARYLDKKPLKGKIAFLITGDEEGPGTFGTCKVLEWLETQNEKPDFCLLAEPTSVEKLADVLKIGRRGSLNALVEVQGRQGHVAYPHLAHNPVPILSKILNEFHGWVLDEGSEYFEPSSLQFTELKTADGASNVIPARASARFNIRFNELHTGKALSEQIRKIISAFPEAKVEIAVSGDSFLTTPGEHVQRLEKAAERVTGYVPHRETGGGTSDARFISKYMPVAELGLVNATMHAIDECTTVEDVEKLTKIFEEFLG